MIYTFETYLARYITCTTQILVEAASWGLQTEKQASQCPHLFHGSISAPHYCHRLVSEPVGRPITDGAPRDSLVPIPMLGL